LLNFVLAESALELVPKEIRGSSAVVSDSRRRGLDPTAILLDRSFHHSAMTRLKDGEKRGRPDLVHAALLSVTGTPLYLDGRVKVLVHTYPDLVLDIAEKTRIPKNYLRFRGLMEKALVEKPGEGLVRLMAMGIRDLIRKVLAPDLTIGLSVQGRPVSLEQLAKKIGDARNPGVLVGGFPRGHFSKETLASLDELLRIDTRPLEAHVVAARLVYEVEISGKGTND
jgi:rRNA small subunit pseudouridine methyltransferase Nep1